MSLSFHAARRYENSNGQSASSLKSLGRERKSQDHEHMNTTDHNRLVYLGTAGNIQIQLGVGTPLFEKLPVQTIQTALLCLMEPGVACPSNHLDVGNVDP